MKPNRVFSDKQNTVQQSFSPSAALPDRRKRGIENAFPSARGKSNYAVSSKYKVEKPQRSDEGLPKHSNSKTMFADSGSPGYPQA